MNTPEDTRPSSALKNFFMPREITRYSVAVATASLLAQMLIVVTGGLVRLTGSGLGCPTWPRCTPDSLVATQEMGIHGIVEFGNRTLTFLLVAVAVLTVLALWRVPQPRMRLLSFSLLLFIPLQAIIGGITVLTNLNPWVVGFHFLVSMPLIAAATVLWNRARRAQPLEIDPVNRGWLIAAAVLTGVALVLGTIVTGSGPHAGDQGAARNGLDPLLTTRAHVLPVYLLVLALVVVCIRLLSARNKAALRPLSWAIAAVLVQGLIGYIQHFLHLPIAVVALHMLGSTLVVATMTHACYMLRGPKAS